jgi:FkbH-like protein
VRALNEGMREVLAALGNAYFLDLSQVLARLGFERFYDTRYWHIGRAPYARDALREVAETATRYWLATRGRARKCLVLDCDNVLWGGIAGEEELAGLALGAEHPGSAFREFQQEVKNFAARGVILALCSKNEPETVWRVFRDHAGMVLQEHDIAASRINWRDKAENLREIAAELNIGLDSLVFLDDSEFEIERVRSALPMVEAVHMPVDRAVDYRNLLLAGGWFDTLAISEEDRSRGAMYRAEADRRLARNAIPDLAGYLRSLEMVAELALAGPGEIARVAQLTQRTNQFNLTTRRYSEHDIRALVEDLACDVLTIRVRDRFGDAGIVGAAILRSQGPLAIVDTLLMSCRVLGRGVEQVLAESCVDLAARRHCSEIEGHYVQSAKNGLVADFWTSLGFGRETRGGRGRVPASAVRSRLAARLVQGDRGAASGDFPMSDADVRGRVVQAMMDIMGVERSALNDEVSPDTLEPWDSLSHMNLVLALEEDFGLRFTDEEIMSMLSIPQIVQTIVAKGA